MTFIETGTLADITLATTLSRAHILVRYIPPMPEKSPHPSAPTVVIVINVDRSHFALGLDHGSMLMIVSKYAKVIDA